MHTLVAHFCSALIAIFCIGGGTGTPAVHATSDVYFFGVQVGAYVDDTQPMECEGAAIERLSWQLVIAGIAPGNYPKGDCPSATYNALEWGQFWGKPPKANAYIIESDKLGPLSGPTPVLTREVMRNHPALVVYWDN